MVELTKSGLLEILLLECKGIDNVEKWCTCWGATNWLEQWLGSLDIKAEWKRTDKPPTFKQMDKKPP